MVSFCSSVPISPVEGDTHHLVKVYRFGRVRIYDFI